MDEDDRSPANTPSREDSYKKIGRGGFVEREREENMMGEHRTVRLLGKVPTYMHPAVFLSFRWFDRVQFETAPLQARAHKRNPSNQKEQPISGHSEQSQ